MALLASVQLCKHRRPSASTMQRIVSLIATLQWPCIKKGKLNLINLYRNNY